MPYRPNFPIAETDNPSTYCLCVEIPDTNAWRAVISGLFFELCYWYNWERDGSDNGAKCAAIGKQIYAGIDWSKMSCCCDETIILYIWNEDGELEQSTDGGASYDPVPEKDPRNNSPVYPPTPGEASDDKSCIAATGMTLLIKEQVGDQLTDDMSRFTLGELIHDWVTTIINTSNPFEALITIAVNQIFALLISAVRAALTTEVYSKLTCAFLAYMEDDLSFTEGDWQAVRTYILATIDGIAGVFLEHLIFLLGSVGLTNLARSQAVTEGDCECGDCDLDTWFIPTGDEYGTIIDQSGDHITVQSHTPASDATYYCILQNTGCCMPTSQEFLDGSITGFNSFVGWNLCGETLTPGVPNHSGALPNDQCMDYIMMRSTIPFTIVTHFTSCT